MVIRWQESKTAPRIEELKEADTCFVTALSLNPALAEALVGRGIVAERRGDRTAAERFFQQAVAVTHDYPTPRNMRRED